MRTRLVATLAGVSSSGLALAADPANGLDQTVIVKQGMSDLSTFFATNGETILKVVIEILLFVILWQLITILAAMVAYRRGDHDEDDYDDYDEEDDD